jgi:hypothetical protein
MPRSGQQLAVFMLTHLFSSLFDNTTQPITSFDKFFVVKSLQIKDVNIPLIKNSCPSFFANCFLKTSSGQISA